MKQLILTACLASILSVSILSLMGALSIGTIGGNVPVGGIIISTGGSCPTAFSEVTAFRGRYVVHVPLSGTINATVGSALSNTENRAAGQHTHIETYQTGGFIYTAATGGAGTSAFGITNLGACTGGNQCSGPVATENGATGGLVSGTNAPYIQVLYCSKN